MGKIEQNKERKQQEILAAAQSIFLSEGYAQTSMDRIAELANMTKQTVYRYFPSKIELFQAMLNHMGKDFNESYLVHLQHEDVEQALLGFAKDFMQHHLSDGHIAVTRLLITESAKSPEIVETFISSGRHETMKALTEFFKQRLACDKPEKLIELWTGMLLSPRSSLLLGMKKPTKKYIEQHAQQATELLKKQFVK